MSIKHLTYILSAACIGLVVQNMAFTGPAFSQEQTAAADPGAGEATEEAPLSEDELEILVARIALYPDELIAVISGASLFPLQVVEAARFLDKYEKDNSLQPDEDWDGSVVSLLNYPEVLRMMSDDLDWTQQLGDALAYQQEDVLIAIQQLREQAVADGIIQTDDKMEVVEEDDNIIIQSTSTETVYVPQYEPEMLYVASYPPTPIAYYPTPYPHYYYPGATFFAGVVTGAIWAGAVDWNNYGVWGGRWNGGDVNIDCNNCFNNRDFNGKVNINDVDWKNVDRSKINIDKNQFNKIDKKNIKNDIKRNTDNSIGKKSREQKKARASNKRPKTSSRDVRKSMQEGLKKPQGGAASRPKANRPSSGNKQAKRPSTKSRPSGAKKAGAKADKRPKNKSSLGHVSKGKHQKVSSKRGAKSMGGGARSSRGGGHKASKHRGGGRHGGGGGGRRR